MNKQDNKKTDEPIGSDNIIENEAPSKPAPIKKKVKEIESSRGVETMFRSAFRTQVDMLSLAAIKANIMIASALVVSGAFIYASEPLFLSLANVFLATSAISIYFAIRAAAPVKRELAKKTKRKALVAEDFKEDNANALIFEDYAQLSKEDYMECMFELLRDNKLIYASMIEQLHWLGGVAKKKFKMLRYAYSVFRGGVTLFILMFLGIQLFVFFSGRAEAGDRPVTAPTSGLAQFKSIYEPSGVQQLADGRIIVVEDDRGLKIVSFQKDGTLLEKDLIGPLVESVTANIEDLEGVAVDAEGYIYVVTSHSRTKNKGVRKVAREQLIRFKIEGDRVVDVATFSGLRDFFEAAGIFKIGRKKPYDLNIEAISFDREKKKLLIGFRFPRVDDKAMIAVLENPAGIFERNEKPRITDKIIYLDIGGKGIRSLSYDTHLGGYLLTNEARLGKQKEKYSRLWFWSGNPEENPQLVTIPGLEGLENAEGVTTTLVGKQPGILIVGDNGNSKKGKPARYLLRTYEQLAI